MTHREIHSSRPFLGSYAAGIYKALAHLPIKHCVDGGAAMGESSLTMLDKAPEATVSAFEPFPGNFPYLDKALADNPRATVHKTALGADMGVAHLHVASVVQGTETGWEDKAGYSSLGRLVESASDKTHEVKITTIDRAVPEHISFLKIDVQGKELEVLQGARDHFANKQIDLCFLEYSAEPGLTDWFFDHGWSLFHAPFMLIGETLRCAELEPTADIVSSSNLSSGDVAEHVWPGRAPTGANDFRDYLKDLKRKFKGAQTDLIAVAPYYMPEFLRAAAHLPRR